MFFPTLTSDAQGWTLPMAGGLSIAAVGCRDTSGAFVVPPVPAGRYTYASRVKFQNNLIGRDEHAAFPGLTIEVTP